MSEHPRRPASSAASSTLLLAALGGLVGVVVTSCSSSDGAGTHPSTLSDAGSDVATPDAGAEAGSQADAADANDAADATTPLDASDATLDVASDDGGQDALDDATDAVADPTCPDPPEAGVITNSTVVPDMTLDKFTAQCAALGGTLEIHPHCGGYNSCRGMSYDIGEQLLTEHTCKGLNTCAGYSCIICN